MSHRSHHHAAINHRSTTWIVLGIGVGMFLLVGALIALSPPSAQSQNGAVSDSALSTLETAYDFGTISMASGKVTVLFNINNAVSSPLTVRKLYTSCMCTSATLLLADRRVGPFSM